MLAVESPRPVVASPRVAPSDLPWFLLWDEFDHYGVVHVYRRWNRSDFSHVWTGLTESLDDFLNLALLGFPDATESTLRKRFEHIRGNHRRSDGPMKPVHVERLMEVFSEGDE